MMNIKNLAFILTLLLPACVPEAQTTTEAPTVVEPIPSTDTSTLAEAQTPPETQTPAETPAPPSSPDAAEPEASYVLQGGTGELDLPVQSNLGISVTPDGPYQAELTATAPTTFYVQGTFTDPSGLADLDIRWLQPDGTAVTITPTPSPDMPFTRVGSKNSACEPDINPEGGSTPTASTCTFQIEVAETASPETYLFIFRASDTNGNKNSSDDASPVTLILQ